MTAPLLRTLPMLRIRVAANRDDPPPLSTGTINYINKSDCVKLQSLMKVLVEIFKLDTVTTDFFAI